MSCMVLCTIFQVLCTVYLVWSCVQYIWSGLAYNISGLVWFTIVSKWSICLSGIKYEMQVLISLL